MLAGVLENGAVGVAGAGAFECDLDADVEEVLLERDDMVVFGSACDFCLIVAQLREESGDFNDGSHGDDAGVGGEGSRWLLGGASVGDSEGLLVGASVGQRLGQERRQDVSRDLVGDGVGRTASGRR